MAVSGISPRRPARSRWRLASFALLFCGCHSGPALSAREIDSLSTKCLREIASGNYDLRRANPRHVGFRKQASPRGTPVVIYGATWCRACDAAESYMFRRSIPYVAFDVEEDPSAKARLEATLLEAGLPSENALPVIDVRGVVTVGFIPCALEHAWGAP